MPQWDTTIGFISVLLTLVISIITPAISTARTNRFQLKLKQIDAKQKEADVKYSKKANIYEKTLETLGRCLHYADRDNSASLGAYIYQLYLYLPQEHWPLLDSIAKNLAAGEIDNIYDLTIQLSKVLSDELSKSMPLNYYEKYKNRKIRK